MPYRCEAYAGLNDSCETNPCGPSLGCVAGICAPLPKVGEPCFDGFLKCDGLFVCVDGLCARRETQKGKRCAESSDCLSGAPYTRCLPSGVCDHMLPLGAACQDRYDCQYFNCIEHVCQYRLGHLDPCTISHSYCEGTCVEGLCHLESCEG